MDNELRASEKLAGRASLGIEQGIRVEIESGGKLAGPWFQTPPRDLSNPEIRWFTWGFDGTATFARRLERDGDAPVAIKVGGQACNGETCRAIDIRLAVPVAAEDEPGAEFSTDGLVRIRTEE